MAMFLGALDQTIVATALPTMGRELGSFELLPWIVTSYLVTSTAITPLYGKVSDIVGRRPTLLVGIGVFVLGSIACALSTTMTTLIFSRALQGLGGGGLISLAQTIIADIVAPKERARYQVYIASVFVELRNYSRSRTRGIFCRTSALVGCVLDQRSARRSRVPDDQQPA